MMLLGKRSRPPIRRTTSMTGITVDLNGVEEPDQAPADYTANHGHGTNGVFDQSLYMMHGGGVSSVPSPRSRRSSLDHQTVEPAPFLRTCGLCKRRLLPGRDLYMYRGDTAFCSQDCRELQMKQDERKETILGQTSSSK